MQALTRLEYVGFHQAKLSSTIPATFWSLEYLNGFNFYQTRISGTIPDMSALTRMTQLKLQETRISGVLTGHHLLI